MKARLFLLGFVLMMMAACRPSPPIPPATPPPIPTLDTPRAKIRAELLQHTPPGTAAAEVLRFIATAIPGKPGMPAPQLEAGPATGPAAAAASGHAGTQHIRIVLGDYVPNPGLLLGPIPLEIENRVTAQWAFDADGRLLDIFVDKTTQLGDQ
jgi:hypothetical protein